MGGAKLDLSARIDLPLDLPFYIEPFGTFNRWDYYRSQSTFFPDKKPPATQNESDEKELESASNSEDEIIPEEQTNSESLEEIEVIPETDSSLRNKAKETGQNYVSQNNFFPNNMGITFCVEPAIEKVKAMVIINEVKT